MAGGYPCECCSGPPCEEVFSSARSADPPADWIEVVGDWSVGAALQPPPSSADSIITAVADAGTPIIRLRVNCSSGGVGGNIVRLLFNYVDISNHYFAEIKYGESGSGHLRVVQKSAGVDTELWKKVRDVSMFGLGINRMAVCYDADDKWLVSFQVSRVANQFSSPAGTVQISGHPLTSTKVGLGATVPGSTVPSFHDFLLERNCPCPYLTCSQCTGEGHNIPNEMQLNVTGVVNGETSCCSGLNATFFTKSRTNCLWYLHLHPTICFREFIETTIHSPAPGTHRLSALFNSFLGPRVINSRYKDSAVLYDCKSLNVVLDTGGQTDSSCDFSGAAVTVTAI